jgi:hypothetical protein
MKMSEDIDPAHLPDVAIEGGEEAHQPLDRVFAKIALEQARDLGLADAHPHAGRCLR